MLKARNLQDDGDYDGWEDEDFEMSAEDEAEMQEMMAVFLDLFIEIFEETLNDPEALDAMVEEEFDTYDKDQDGFLNDKEMQDVMNELYSDMGVEGTVEEGHLDLAL